MDGLVCLEYGRILDWDGMMWLEGLNLNARVGVFG